MTNRDLIRLLRELEAQEEDFIRKFYQFRNLNANKKNSYVYNAKKFIKRFTLLSHYNELKKLIV